MSKQIFLPESMYSVNSEMNHKKLQIFYKNNSSITGRVTRLNLEDKLLEVDIGNEIIAIMPFDDATIYKIYNEDGSITPNIFKLVGKNIRAKISAIISNHIFLSRKENMLEALETIKYETVIPFAQITGFSKISAFFDMGAGILGKSYEKHFSNIIFNNIKDIGIKVNTIIPIKILSFLPETNHFNLSRVETLPKAEDVLSQGETVICKVFDKVHDKDEIGYYVLIDTKFCGIVDSTIELEYGSEIVAIIKKITDKGPKLKMVEKL